MLTKQKIQAFTLSEMVIVIIITSIVVGMAFSVLRLVQKHMKSIQDNLSHTTEIQKLEQSLMIDCNTYQEIRFHPETETLYFKSEIDSIIYQFSEAHIIKNTDTFHIELAHKQFFLKGNPVQNGQLDAIQLETTKTYQNQHVFVYKINDPTLEMNTWHFD